MSKTPKADQIRLLRERNAREAERQQRLARKGRRDELRPKHKLRK